MTAIVESNAKPESKRELIKSLFKEKKVMEKLENLIVAVVNSP